MKRILLTFSCFLILFSVEAQYKDSLKTYRKLTKSTEKNSDFVFIPSTSFVRGSNDSDLPTPDMNGFYLRSHTVSVDSFFMQKFEVSNKLYLEFVSETLTHDSLLGKAYLPDTLVWRMPQGYNEPYVEYYFRHPAYENFPVVGVSYVQAKAFAAWQTEKYNTDEERIFKKVKFRLPTEEEWEYAAKGGHRYSYLPWGEYTTIDEDGNSRANFRVVSQLGVYRDSVPVENRGFEKKRPVYISGVSFSAIASAGGADSFSNDITIPVDALKPNPYGLYNMSGNVEEMVDAYYLRDINAYQFTHDIRTKSTTPWGVTKGGSWNDTGYYLQYPIRQFYEDTDDTSAEVGFRLVMEVLDY